MKIINYKISIHEVRTGVWASPFDIGFDLLALNIIFINPNDTTYLSLVWAFLCLNKKKNKPIFNGIKAIVKNTMNLIYPTW